LSDVNEVIPATDEEIAQYEVDCVGTDNARCASCFVGPALSECPSFLCRRDVARLVARIRILKSERDQAEARLLKALEDLAAQRRS
jgi:hypothetical protein